MIWNCIKKTMPIFWAFFPLGLALGCYAQSMQLPGWLTMAISIFSYAGSSEFLAVSMIAAGASLTEIIGTTIAVNFRHVFYGISVMQHIPVRGWLRFYSIITLCDEAYALLTTIPEEDPKANTLMSFLIHAYWVGSVACGIAIGGLLKDGMQGIEFCLTALFVVLAIEQMHKMGSSRYHVVAIVAGGLALITWPQQFLVVAILASILICYGKYRMEPSYGR